MFSDAPIGVRPQPPAARRRSPETWAAAREAYLEGQSAPEVCERFDVGLSALRRRAANEDWRRSDQADPAPREPTARNLPPEALEEDPPLSSAEMAELSRKRARRAMLEGSVKEAQSWTRVHESWRKLAAEDAETARRLAEAAETPEQAFARRVERLDHHDRLDALMRADRETRGAARAEPDDAHKLHEASGLELRDLHKVDDLHDLHSSLQAEDSRTPLNRHRRRALARLEALKARHAARDGP